MPHRATHVLIVEDDEMVQSLLTAFLQESGYSVTAVGSAGAMWRILDTDRIDILLLDLGLPDEDGIAVARQFRARYETPIIVLTARTGHGDRLAALEIGADDYLVKPFDPREMTLRIENLLARSRGTAAQAQSESMALGSVRLNLEAHSLTLANGAEVSLTPSEYSVLVALARAPNRVLSRDHLLDALARTGDAPGERVIDVVVGRLRKKIGDDPKHPQVIKTVPGFGYLYRPGRD